MQRGGPPPAWGWLEVLMLPRRTRCAGTQRVPVGRVCARVEARLWRRALLCWSARGGRARRPTCGLCLERVCLLVFCK